MKLINYFEQQSYALNSDVADAKISVCGGHITADFDLDGKKVNPYFIAPWWNEANNDLIGSCEYPLRGIFFCFPFGMSKPYQGIERPCHGFPPTRNWEFEKLDSNGDSKTIELSINIPEENADIKQRVTVRNGHTALYISNSVKGASGRYPVGYHPTLKIPCELGNSILDMSEYKECLTSPTHIDLPENGGYCSLPTDYVIEDETNVPTVYGNNVNLKRQPFIKGFDDIYMYVFDSSHDFDYAAMSVPSEGYLYYQLKNPVQLSNSMIWTSYCGRHYPKWNSRVNGCLEIGAGTNYFFYGLTGALTDDPLTKRGYTMFHEFDGSEREYKLISGVVKIPSDYKGVASISKKDDKTIVINGRNGSVIETACCVDFLK